MARKLRISEDALANLEDALAHVRKMTVRGAEGIDDSPNFQAALEVVRPYVWMWVQESLEEGIAKIKGELPARRGRGNIGKRY